MRCPKPQTPSPSRHWHACARRRWGIPATPSHACPCRTQHGLRIAKHMCARVRPMCNRNFALALPWSSLPLPHACTYGNADGGWWAGRRNLVVGCRASARRRPPCALGTAVPTRALHTEVRRKQGNEAPKHRWRRSYLFPLMPNSRSTRAQLPGHTRSHR